MRSSESQTRHNKRVFEIASEGTRKNWVVYADHCDEFEKPQKIRGHIPDVYAKNGGRELVIEVETNDSLGTLHASAQKFAFSLWEKESSNRTFRVVMA